MIEIIKEIISLITIIIGTVCVFYGVQVIYASQRRLKFIIIFIGVSILLIMSREILRLSIANINPDFFDIATRSIALITVCSMLGVIMLVRKVINENISKLQKKRKRKYYKK